MRTVAVATHPTQPAVDVKRAEAIGQTKQRDPRDLCRYTEGNEGTRDATIKIKGGKKKTSPSSANPLHI